jgi:creatinine amidohydrolase
VRGLFIEHLTWVEVEAALKGFDTLLLPVGARCKEHGPHLPLNTDFLFAEYLAGRVAEACRVMVAPTVPYGFYPAFVEYPGSAHVRAEAFPDTIVDVCGSFLRHGLRKFYVLNTGISTMAPLAEAKELLARDGARLEYSDLRALGAAARKSVERQPHGTHADEIETSIMLYVAPQVVRLDRARPELAPDSRGGLTRDPDRPGVYSPTGSWGDPTLATVEKGRLVTEAVVAEIVTFVAKEFGV